MAGLARFLELHGTPLSDGVFFAYLLAGTDCSYKDIVSSRSGTACLANGKYRLDCVYWGFSALGVWGYAIRLCTL